MVYITKVYRIKNLTDSPTHNLDQVKNALELMIKKLEEHKSEVIREKKRKKLS